MTGFRILLFGLLATCVGTLSAFAPVERGAVPVPSLEPTSADTLRFEIAAGDPLIVALPARVDGAEASYTIDEAPALSWLVDRSFFYQTVRGERGTLAIRLRRMAATGAESPVVLIVTITA